ncbi:MAG: CehA/McbA family metallohydrolase [Pseudomonadales bacterium]
MLRRAYLGEWCKNIGLFLIILLLSIPAFSAIKIVTGPTAIPKGDAQAANDITISNGLFALAFAIESKSPWGVPRGGIVDVAVLRDGKPSADFASLVDFMPNNWSAWPNSYSETRVEQASQDTVVVVTRRDWGDVSLETRFTVRDGESIIQLHTKMQNTSKLSTDELLSGYVAWPDGGHLFGMPGLSGQVDAPETKAFGDWSTAYDKDWLLALHAPFSDQMKYSGRDRYKQHVLAPGEAREFEVWLQVESSGSLSKVVDAELALTGNHYAQLSGFVRDAAGALIDSPAVIVQKSGKVLAWTLGDAGEYTFKLPRGDYELYATAEGYGLSDRLIVTLEKGQTVSHDFSDVPLPGSLEINVSELKTGEPMDARISVLEGQESPIAFFGRSTFFTDLNDVGIAKATVAPGQYVLELSSGGGFTSQVQNIPASVESNKTKTLNVEIPVILSPTAKGWYSADLHHHSDVLDGFTDPEYVVRSELAANLDILFLSDHDSTANNAAMRRLATKRQRPFIAGTELSASWAHFNAYPINEDKALNLDTSVANVAEVFAEARRLGADVIHVNHPYNEYGYFTNLDEGHSVPGGYNDGFDLVEIIAGSSNQKTLERCWSLWNEGKRAYLAAGSDAHNVWQERSGSARSYVHISGEPTVANYIAGLKAGRSFASQGPIVYPSIQFGDTLAQKAGEVLALDYELHSVEGIKSVRIISAGREVGFKEYKGAPKSSSYRTTVTPVSNTWYSIIVEDVAGQFAYGNPVWVTTETGP